MEPNEKITHQLLKRNIEIVQINIHISITTSIIQHPNMVVPNFRRIFASFRSELEEKQIANAAFFKFCLFVVVVVGMSVGRGRGFKSIANS